MQSRRDRSSELIVALAVMGTLALGLAFGIILTLSSQVDEAATPSVTATDATTVAGAPSATPTPREVRPSATFTRTATVGDTPTPRVRSSASSTAAPSDTPRATRTPRPTETVAPRATRTPRRTSAAAEVATQTATSTRTPTPSATATRTPRPSATPRATRTPRPTASATPSVTPSRTPSPSATPTITPSRTFTPSATPRATRTPRPSATRTSHRTPSSQATLTFTPYPTLTPSITPFGGEQTRTPSASGCPIPEAWIAYSVQSGDTLFGLARRWGLRTDELAEANCLDDPNAITVGQILYAPSGSDVTVRPTTAAGAGTARYARFNCDNPTATISDPRAGAVLRGTVGIYGTATHPDFQFYRLQISGSEQPENFATLGMYHQQVIEGQLGTLNTAAFAPGDYWLRLTVVDNTANYPPECTVRVRIER